MPRRRATSASLSAAAAPRRAASERTVTSSSRTRAASPPLERPSSARRVMARASCSSVTASSAVCRAMRASRVAIAIAATVPDHGVGARRADARARGTRERFGLAHRGAAITAEREHLLQRDLALDAGEARLAR